MASRFVLTVEDWKGVSSDRVARVWSLFPCACHQLSRPLLGFVMRASAECRMQINVCDGIRVPLRKQITELEISRIETFVKLLEL